MISVSEAFKTAVKASSAEFSAYIDDNEGNEITNADDLKNWTIKANGYMFQTILREATAVYWGDVSLKGKHVNLGFGVKLADTSIETVDMGTFYVTDEVEDKDTEQVTATMYDKMYEALKSYALFDVEYPMTLKQYVEAICTELGWTLGTATFLNDDVVVSADLFALQGLTYRDVLEQVAELTCTMIYFNNDDELVLAPLGSSSVETLNTSLLKKLDTEANFGAVNSVVLARTPVEQDFVYDGGYESPPILLESGDTLLSEDGQDLLLEILVEIDGLYQIRFENNMFTDADPDTYLPSLSTALTGLTFTPFEVKTIFLGYLELGDKVTLVDRNSVSYTSYICEIELKVGDEIKEIIRTQVPEKSRTNYKKSAGVITNTMKKTELDGDRNIKDETITSAKIKELTADKIKTGALQVGTEITIPDDDGNVLIYIANVEVEE